MYKKKGLWCIPLQSKKQVVRQNKDTLLSKQSPIEILGDSEQPPLEQICNVYEIKVHPEIIRY